MGVRQVVGEGGVHLCLGWVMGMRQREAVVHLCLGLVKGRHHREGVHHLHHLHHLQKLVGMRCHREGVHHLHHLLRLVGMGLSRKEGGVHQGLSLVVGSHRERGRVRRMEVWGSLLGLCLCVEGGVWVGV